MAKWHLGATAGLAVTLFVAVPSTYAQPYPSKPIRMVVPCVAGGPADATARTLAPRLAESMGQQVIIDNRGGAGGIIGIDTEMVKALSVPAVRQKLSPGGAQFGGSKPEDYAVFLRSEVAKWGRIVKAAGITS